MTILQCIGIFFVGFWFGWICSLLVEKRRWKEMREKANKWDNMMDAYDGYIPPAKALYKAVYYCPPGEIDGHVTFPPGIVIRVSNPINDRIVETRRRSGIPDDGFFRPRNGYQPIEDGSKLNPPSGGTNVERLAREEDCE
jgi:hypothetical protein